MERLLALYARLYDPDYPVVCFDERPCFHYGALINLSRSKAVACAQSTTPMKKGLLCLSGRD